MGSNILNIGRSALAAAQAGISTTGHNIANAATPGYSRQVVVQEAAQAQNFGYGYVGQGTQVSTIQRVFNQVLATQMNNSQALSSQYATYSTQMGQINNMLADSKAGLSPALSDFFDSIQDLTTNPGDAASRQAMLSSSQALASRFQSLGGQLNELQQGVNTQLTSSVGLVNSYSKQIADLNDAIEKAIGGQGTPPNDLMDQRDYLVSQLSKEVKTTVVSQGNSYNVFIGNGLPLVVGKDNYRITAVNSASNPERLEVAYVGASKTIELDSTTLSGGNIGGLLQFRKESLDTAQNQLGQIALVLADSFNTQHQQGLDLNGAQGGNFFNVPAPVVRANGSNTGNAVVGAQISNVNAVTTSDYRLKFDGTNYSVTRLSDNQVQTFSSLPQTVDGFTLSLTSGSMAAGDSYLVQPTATAASTLSVAITDVNKIAAGAPVVTTAKGTGNSGTGAISGATVAKTYSASPLGSSINLTYNSGSPNVLSGFPASQSVTVTVGTSKTVYPAGATVPYTPGAVYTVAGVSFSVSGSPANGDTFTISPNNSNASGNNTNALALAGLQTAKTVNGNISYQSAFAQMVSSVGNKTRELQVNSAAEEKLLAQATQAMQSESGVNLDEEATNLLRYQQAYQAAGKVMQIASQMFDVLLALGSA